MGGPGLGSSRTTAPTTPVGSAKPRSRQAPPRMQQMQTSAQSAGAPAWTLVTRPALPPQQCSTQGSGLGARRLRCRLAASRRPRWRCLPRSPSMCCRCGCPTLSPLHRATRPSFAMRCWWWTFQDSLLCLARQGLSNAVSPPRQATSRRGTGSQEGEWETEERCAHSEARAPTRLPEPEAWPRTHPGLATPPSTWTPSGPCPTPAPPWAPCRSRRGLALACPRAMRRRHPPQSRGLSAMATPQATPRPRQPVAPSLRALPLRSARASRRGACLTLRSARNTLRHLAPTAPTAMQPCPQGTRTVCRRSAAPLASEPAPAGQPVLMPAAAQVATAGPPPCTMRPRPTRTIVQLVPAPTFRNLPRQSPRGTLASCRLRTTRHRACQRMAGCRRTELPRRRPTRQGSEPLPRRLPAARQLRTRGRRPCPAGEGASCPITTR
mmetsp:Transcript_24274/g.91608  ORF Transcript_24274/g.91608 Transcript_24274/m.91608 type:complete len:437 (+) Transcript_24274:2566-3876(+)